MEFPWGLSAVFQAAYLTPGILQEVRAEPPRCTAQVQKAEAILRHEADEVVVGFEKLIHDTEAFLEMHLIEKNVGWE